MADPRTSDRCLVCGAESVELEIEDGSGELALAPAVVRMPDGWAAEKWGEEYEAPHLHCRACGVSYPVTPPRQWDEAEA